MKLVDIHTKEEIKVGDKVITFRGKSAIISYIWPPGTSQGGMNGRVGLEGEQMLYNVAVVQAEFVE
jgi:hypothetical protein